MVSPPLPRLLTHALLHAPDRPAELPRELCELEAESVAFAICLGSLQSECETTCGLTGDHLARPLDRTYVW